MIGLLSRTLETMPFGHEGMTPADRIRLALSAEVVFGGLLTALAGFVDTIGYIGLGGLFASVMSGASVSLGVRLGDGDREAVCRGAMMIASPLGGVTLGTVLTGGAGAWALPAVLFLEALLLAGAALLAAFGAAMAISILPIIAAMGVQNTALPSLNGVRLGVTFITGTLVTWDGGSGRSFLGGQPWRLGGHALLWCGAHSWLGPGRAIVRGAFGPGPCLSRRVWLPFGH